MVKLREFHTYINELLLSSMVADSCPNGLQVEGEDEIKSFATAVSASLETIQAAAALGVQALIVHHGMFWNGDSYTVTGTKRAKLDLLLKHKMSLLAYHLPLDMNQEVGNNWKAARDLGWTDLQPFGMYKGMAIGVKGRIMPVSCELLQQQLEAYYQHAATSALGGKDEVSSIALISGGAYRSLTEAAAEGLDCFITGNFDEPAWHQAYEEKINFFAMGHSATERIGPQALGEHLRLHFGLEHHFIDIPNPF